MGEASVTGLIQRNAARNESHSEEKKPLAGRRKRQPLNVSRTSSASNFASTRAYQGTVAGQTDDACPATHRSGKAAVMALHDTTQQELLRALPHLRAFAISLSGNVDRADDLVQETLLRALANIDRFQPGTCLQAWLFTILRNLFHTEFRRRRRRSRIPMEFLPAAWRSCRTSPVPSSSASSGRPWRNCRPISGRLFSSSARRAFPTRKRRRSPERSSERSRAG